MLLAANAIKLIFAKWRSITTVLWDEIVCLFVRHIQNDSFIYIIAMCVSWSYSLAERDLIVMFLFLFQELTSLQHENVVSLLECKVFDSNTAAIIMFTLFLIFPHSTTYKSFCCTDDWEALLFQ